MLVDCSDTIDVPNLEEGIRFDRDVFGFVETARPVDVYAVLTKGESTIGLIERAAGTKPAEGSDDLRWYERQWTPVHVDFRVDDLEGTLKRVLSVGAKTETREKTCAI